MSIYRCILEDNVFRDADAKRRKIPYSADTSFNQIIGCLLCNVYRTVAHRFRLLWFLVSFYKFIGMINRDIVDLVFTISSLISNPAKIFNPYCSSPESDSKAAPRLPTPNKTALWLERNPRNSSSTSMS